MGQSVKTVRVPFETLLSTLATNTTLGTATEHTFAAITLQLPESSKTIRCAVLKVRVRDAAPTTARRLDGVRIGVQIDAVAFDDLDWTGTGITNTGDHWSACADRDVTSYFVTNYTGTSHTIGVRVRFETDVADVVNNITCELVVTYEYDDSSTTQVKTVRIGLEGLTGFLGTTANGDIRGSAGSGQIPALDTFLPEAGKTIDHIWFEIEATDSGNAATDFNVNYSIDAGTTAVRATLKQGLNTSVRFYDIWPTTFDTSVAHDFEAWSSLASAFERFMVTLHVTYRYNASTSTRILNSILVPINCHEGTLQNAAAGDQDLFETEVWIEEPGTITLKQSVAYLVFDTGAADTITLSVSGHDAAGGAQGTTSSAYAVAARVDSGTKMLQHRIDLAHGGTAITLGRGKNTLRLKVFGSTVVNIYGMGGYFILNYESDKSSLGVGSHNNTTEWQRSTIMNAFATTSAIVVGTAEQKTPIIPQTNYFINALFWLLDTNASSTSMSTLSAAIDAAEGPGDGWAKLGTHIRAGDQEYGYYTLFYPLDTSWKKYVNDPYSKRYIDVETARVLRLYGFFIAHDSIKSFLTLHGLTFTVGGTISGSSGGTVNIALLDATTFEVLLKTTRLGNGTYTFEWYDNTREVIVLAYETDSLKGASKQAVAGVSDFDISLASGGSATVGGRILII